MNIDAPTQVENRASSPERAASAKHIYQGLRENVGRATLFGFHGGNVYLDAQAGRQRQLQINRIYTNASSDIPNFYRKMGFTHKDIASGIVQVYEAEGSDKQPIPHLINQDSSAKRILYISGTGKVLEKDDPHAQGREESFHRTRFDSYVYDGIQRLALLSSIPNTILDTFGSYEEFKDALGGVDMNGIETEGELSALHNQVVYYSGPNGRLKEYTERLEQIRKGQPSDSMAFHITRDDLELGDFKTFSDTLDSSVSRKSVIQKWLSHKLKLDWFKRTAKSDQSNNQASSLDDEQAAFEERERRYHELVKHIEQTIPEDVLIPTTPNLVRRTDTAEHALSILNEGLWVKSVDDFQHGIEELQRKTEDKAENKVAKHKNAQRLTYKVSPSGGQSRFAMIMTFPLTIPPDVQNAFHEAIRPEYRREMSPYVAYLDWNHLPQNTDLSGAVAVLPSQYITGVVDQDNGQYYTKEQFREAFGPS